MGTPYSVLVHDDGLFYKALFHYDGDISSAGLELYIMLQDPKCIIEMVRTNPMCISSQCMMVLLDYMPVAYAYILNDDGSISVTDGNKEKLYYSLEMQLMELNLIPKTLTFRFLNLFFPRSIIMEGIE